MTENAERLDLDALERRVWLCAGTNWHTEVRASTILALIARVRQAELDFAIGAGRGGQS